MTNTITPKQAKRLLGRPVYAVRKDGTVATGRLVKVKAGRIFLSPLNKKEVSVKGLLPLTLLTLGGLGGFGYPGAGFGGFGAQGFGYPGYGYGVAPGVAPGLAPGVAPGLASGLTPGLFW
jgi:hypothetical protein